MSKKKLIAGMIMGAMMLGSVPALAAGQDTVGKVQQAVKAVQAVKDRTGSQTPTDKDSEHRQPPTAKNGEQPPEPPTAKDGLVRAQSQDATHLRPPKDENGKPLPPPDGKQPGQHDKGSGDRQPPTAKNGEQPPEPPTAKDGLVRAQSQDATPLRPPTAKDGKPLPPPDGARDSQHDTHAPASAAK